jgi:hypothetical protein
MTEGIWDILLQAGKKKYSSILSVSHLVQHRSMTSACAWAELMDIRDIRSASIWRNLALAQVEVLKVLSNTGVAQRTRKRSKRLMGN